MGVTGYENIRGILDPNKIGIPRLFLEERKRLLMLHTPNRDVITSAIRHKRRRLFWVGGALCCAVIAAMIVSVNVGQAPIDLRAILRVLLGKSLARDALLQGIPSAQIAIVWDIRLPRILLAVIVGGGLAVSGTVFQALLLNPLADPYTIGVSTGAAFGAVVAIYLNLSAASTLLSVPVCAFIGALLTLLIVLNMAMRRGCLDTTHLILAGIIVSSILSAGISLLKTASGEQVSAIVAWLMGSLAARTWQQVWLGWPVVLAGTLMCWYFSGELNLLSLGEQDARSLGVRVQMVRRVCVITASLIAAVCVSVSGVIGFVGLIVPHLLRVALTSDNRALLPLAALTGGLLLLLADNLSRLLFAVEIPVGVITTLLGGPFFLLIFLKSDRNQ